MAFTIQSEDIPIKDNEHIMVGLSASPSNARIIEAAAKMAKAFFGAFTAVYIQSSKSQELDEEDKERLKSNICLAEKLGASVSTIYGDDVAFQLAEYAKLSGVTKIVIGRSAMRHKIFKKPTLADRLISIIPNIDIHIIPDGNSELIELKEKIKIKRKLVPTFKDIFITFSMLAVASAICFLFLELGYSEANIIIVYILGVLITSVASENIICWGFSAVASVLLFNFFFIEPRFSLLAYDKGYLITFAIMLIASLITGSLASKMKELAKHSSQVAYRTKILFDANKLLQKAKTEDEIFDVTAKQLKKLLDCNIVFYTKGKDIHSKPLLHCVSNETNAVMPDNVQEIVDWVYENKQSSSVISDKKPNIDWNFLPIASSGKVYGIIGISDKENSIGAFESSILQSITGECALALENICNAKEKELSAIEAKNEQLRANLLRMISHDLRTPLTSISGNVTNLMNNEEIFDARTRQQIYSDIYDDSMWLIGLVENLLSITRLEQDKMNITMCPELLADIIAEALKHVDRKISEYEISVENGDDLLCVNVDARLIVQVLINLIDNAVKYTSPHSKIKLLSGRKDNMAFVSVIDNGPGISDDIKPMVFDMFYTGKNQISDSKRSLGLGLALCKSIIAAHGGKITLSDNTPSGAIFTFTLPVGEVNINE